MRTHDSEKLYEISYTIFTFLDDDNVIVSIHFTLGKNVTSNLKELTDRKLWEQQFHDCYISSVVKDTELSLQQALQGFTSKGTGNIIV